MEAALEPNVAFVGALDGDFIFPGFIPAYDGIMSLFKLMEYLALSGSALSKMVNEMPEYHIACNDTFCPWDKKGLVMRKVLEYAKDKETEMIDGIKIINGTGWVLVLPDPDEPKVTIYAESHTQESADAEVLAFTNFLEDIISGVSK
jgi:mannose-1-phosphate guanylyltransferase/phosphomannomutase